MSKRRQTPEQVLGSFIFQEITKALHNPKPKITFGRVEDHPEFSNVDQVINLDAKASDVETIDIPYEDLTEQKNINP